MKTITKLNFNYFKLKNIPLSTSSCAFRFFATKKEAYYNPKSPQERLNTKASNVASSNDQIQNYEKHLLNMKQDEEVDVSKAIDNLFENLESTNSQYLKNEADLKDPKGISFNDFIYQSDKLLTSLCQAFRELLSQDENLSLEIGKNNFYIKINVKDVGVYIISKELESQLVTVTSPVSGLFKYKYEPKSNYWISTKDKHILDELITREFCKHSKGLLIINH